MKKKIKFINTTNYLQKEVRNILTRRILRSIYREIIEQFHLLPHIYYYIWEVDDTTMQQLNYQLRQQKTRTNVVSHAVWDDLYLIRNFSKGQYLFIGHIYFNSQQITEEAQNWKISLHQHLIHLIIHSILHLLGFDHLTVKDASIMEYWENKLLQKIIGYQPWLDRDNHFKLI